MLTLLYVFKFRILENCKFPFVFCKSVVLLEVISILRINYYFRKVIFGLNLS
ncbi:hypothetical protein LEP1GSC170_5999 [Leptospira interrogans serovar Bataviae str. HAI135]|uniref:Uncharacterized protein n=1 Tax=Leptospira noguchii serovar Autumnalis str. ZUN142 TaxID=1085540 RepID=M6UCI2_9LEPT|nr:hypothetical protein LEP1GSC170_5999 [Leptospira interrogans serovar Bataviae str. HAI135]EMO42265.1 hypothetical protein LEP1GSC186_0463 [Leptospira noguchii serovar Autumnalis str. ZUN142]